MATISETILGEIKTAIDRGLARIPSKTPNAFIAAGHTWQLARIGNRALLSTRLRTLQITTEYTIDGAHLYPTFGHKEDAAPFTLQWTAPPEMVLVFGIAAELRSNEFVWKACYLFARNGAPGYRTLPLANHMPDGTLCYGRTFNATTKTLPDLAERCYARLQEPYNTDAQPRLSDTAKLFRWDWPSLRQSATPPDWTAHAQLKNHLDYELLDIEGEKAQMPAPTAPSLDLFQQTAYRIEQSGYLRDYLRDVSGRPTERMTARQFIGHQRRGRSHDGHPLISTPDGWTIVEIIPEPEEV